MDTKNASRDTGTEAAQLVRARVTAVRDDDTVLALGEDGRVLRCEVLRRDDRGVVHLSPSDEVLCWRPPLAGDTGVILGRLGSSTASRSAADTAVEGASQRIPEELILEAKDCLSLRVGDGSITIRADGKILIKGRDLVSHAQRANRIKGGSVSIN